MATWSITIITIFSTNTNGQQLGDTLVNGTLLHLFDSFMQTHGKSNTLMTQ